MWVSKNDLEKRIAELEKDVQRLSSRMGDAERAIQNRTEITIPTGKNACGFDTYTGKQIKDIIEAVLIHFNLEMHHREAKEILELKEKQPESEST
ncbi:MAG: hypothetical protein HZB61_10230 [Nitrospirae bacterium]|nr:hypothetical protein [Nitrospirota bacterium]